MEKTIEIPEGYEARIDGNKVILEPKENEDERIRKDIVAAVEMRGDLTQGRKSEIYAWLKSIRPQPHWKPSEEQMKELLNALIPGKDFDCDILAELYGQLKKLM